MKRVSLFLIALFFTISLFAQNSAYDKTIHRDYGTFRVINNENIVSVSAFCTIELFVEEIEYQEPIRLKESKIRKLGTVEPTQNYRYELYLVSKSVFDGDTTNTWLYGTKIFIDGEYVLEKQFPDGFIISIKTVPTLVHTHNAFNEFTEFEITWEKAIYEPRIRK